MGMLQEIGHRVVQRGRDAVSSTKELWRELRYEGVVSGALGVGIRFGKNNRRMIARHPAMYSGRRGF